MRIISVKFSPDSELQTIEKYAFMNSSIEYISIPSTVTRICEGAFALCKELKQITIPTNSKLQTIESYAFICAPIESFTIPSSVVELQECWCSMTTDLKKVKVLENNQNFISKDDKFIFGKTDEKSDNFDVLIFVSRELKSVTIPNNITKIASSAFSGSEIESIEISPNVKE